jgi:hypothetical protein
MNAIHDDRPLEKAPAEAGAPLRRVLITNATGSLPEMRRRYREETKLVSPVALL